MRPATRKIMHYCDENSALIYWVRTSLKIKTMTRGLKNEACLSLANLKNREIIG
jgi:hypothetical protein